MWAWVIEQLRHNQFFSGAALGGIITAAFMLAKGYAISLIQWVKSYFTLSVTIHSEDPSYHVWLQWIRQQQFDKVHRRYRVRDGLELTPAYGTFCVWVSRSPMWVTLTRDDKVAAGYSGPPKEVLTIYTYVFHTKTTWFTEVLKELETKGTYPLATPGRGKSPFGTTSRSNNRGATSREVAA